MAKQEYKLHGDFDAILKKIEKAAIDGSLTALSKTRRYMNETNAVYRFIK